MNDFGPSSTDISLATPFMDSLAKEGVQISRYYTNHICTPARSSIMTGRDTFRTGMQFEELDNSMPWGVPLDEVTLAERFKAAGYATHMSLLYEGGGSHTFNDYGYGDKDGYIDHSTNTTRLGLELKGNYSTSLTAERGVAIASEHMEANEAAGTDNPLFLYLAFQAAHSPMDVPGESLFTEEQLENMAKITSESSIRLEFAKIVYFMDIMVERLINDLDVMGMMDNTLLVVASDNGGCPAAGGSNYPLRGFKHTLFEGGVRTPALVYSSSDSIIPAEARGTIYEGMMHAVDWTPTLANVTGIPTDGMGKTLSGFDQWSAIIGDRPESAPPVRNEVVLGRNSYVFDDEKGEMVHTAEPRGAYIYDGWKINIGDKCTGWFSFNPIDSMLADPECKVGECPTCTDDCVYNNDQNNSFLFHLEEDPYEMHNLIDLMPDKFEEMVQRWDNATVDEVKSNFLPEDPESVERACEYRAAEYRNCSSAAALRASKSDVLTDEVSSEAEVEKEKKVIFPTGSAWSRSDGMGTVGPSEAVGAGAATHGGVMTRWANGRRTSPGLKQYSTAGGVVAVAVAACQRFRVENTPEGGGAVEGVGVPGVKHMDATGSAIAAGSVPPCRARRGRRTLSDSHCGSVAASAQPVPPLESMPGTRNESCVGGGQNSPRPGRRSTVATEAETIAAKLPERRGR
eukprot:jgi/Undpi1/8305/HiC_scaffold_25.g10774.m1